MDRQRTISLKRPRATKYGRFKYSKLTRTLGAFPLKMRLSYTWKIIADVTGGCDDVGNLTGFLQASNDWASCKALYATYKMNKCLVQYIPNFGVTPASVSDQTLFGIAYDHSNATALTNINQVADYENYMFGLPGAAMNVAKSMKFRVRALNSPGPYNTNESTNYAGFLKLYMKDNAYFEENVICTLIFQFYVTFSGLQ